MAFLRELREWLTCHAANGWKGIYSCRRLCWKPWHAWRHYNAIPCYHFGRHHSFSGDRW